MPSWGSEWGGEWGSGADELSAALEATGTVSVDFLRELSLSADLEGTAACTVGALSQELLVAIEGTAQVSATISKDISISLDLEGVAQLSAAVAKTVQVQSDLEGNSLLSAMLSLSVTLDAVLQGAADLTVEMARDFDFDPGSLIGVGALIVVAELFRPVVNPARGGDLVDFTDPAAFLLTVNSTPIDFANGNVDPVFNMGDLTVSYDGKELSFSQFSSISSPVFRPEQTAALDIDFDDGLGLLRVFTGRIRSMQRVGRNNNEEIIYHCAGNHILANHVTMVGTDGKPSVTFTVGTTVTSVTSQSIEVIATFVKPISEAINDLFVLHASALNTIGIPASIGYPGLTQFTSNLPETVQLQNVGFADGIAQLAAYERGVRLLWNDKQQKWVFPNMLTADIAIVNVNSVNLPELSIESTTEGRYTAVRLFSDFDDLLDDVIDGQDGRFRNGVVSRSEVQLIPTWTASLESVWSIPDLAIPRAGAGGVVFSQNFSVPQMIDDLWNVHRLYAIPASITPQWPGTPVTAWAQFTGANSVEFWERISGRANFDTLEFTAQFPVIHPDSLSWLRRKVKKADQVTLSYYPLNFNFTFVSTVNSAGTPTLATTQIDAATLLDEIRRPPSGFEGTAFTEFGVEREFIQIVNRTEVTTANAQAILDMRKDIIVSGTLPIEGDPLRPFTDLNVRVLVQHPTRITGVQTHPALVTEVGYTFGKRGVTNIALTTDVAGLIRTT